MKKGRIPRLLQSINHPGGKERRERQVRRKTGLENPKPKKEKPPARKTDGLVNFRASDDSYSYTCEGDGW